MQGWGSGKAWVGWEMVDSREPEPTVRVKPSSDPGDQPRAGQGAAWSLLGSTAGLVIGQTRGQRCGIWAM